MILNVLAMGLIAIAQESTPSIGTGLQRPDVEYQIFQFPANEIPRIDGDDSDWAKVPQSYAIGMDQLEETTKNGAVQRDRKDLDVSVKIGWVKGLNQLYFLYQAQDDYWDFAKPDLHNDIFELVVDADMSGGPLIRQSHPNAKLRDQLSTHFIYHGIHAQNYHIFTPAQGKDWAMVWGSQPWIKELPWANSATRYDFKPGESGKLTLEFYITPFDFAPPESERAVVSKLEEGKTIAMSWAILDYDDEHKDGNDAFWNLSHKTTMYGDASDLVGFKLMPLEVNMRKLIDANWSFQVLSWNERRVAFRDESTGKVEKWKWDFGDGETSTEQHPIHSYQKAGEFVVVLYVEGPDGKSRRSKVWDVTLP